MDFNELVLWCIENEIEVTFIPRAVKLEMPINCPPLKRIQFYNVKTNLVSSLNGTDWRELMYDVEHRLEKIIKELNGDLT